MKGPPAEFPSHQQAKASLVHLADRIEKAYSHYVFTIIERNHGIRQANLLALLLPVGVLETDVDKTWLNSIDSFGDRRGDTAHQSGRVQQPVDPAAELSAVNAIAAGIKPLDARLTKLYRR